MDLKSPFGMGEKFHLKIGRRGGKEQLKIHKDVVR